MLTWSLRDVRCLLLLPWSQKHFTTALDPQVFQELSTQTLESANCHLREEPMQLYHRYRQSDHTREDSVNEKAILSSAASRELLLADML